MPVNITKAYKKIPVTAPTGLIMRLPMNEGSGVLLNESVSDVDYSIGTSSWGSDANGNYLLPQGSGIIFDTPIPMTSVVPTPTTSFSIATWVDNTFSASASGGWFIVTSMLANLTIQLSGDGRYGGPSDGRIATVNAIGGNPTYKSGTVLPSGLHHYAWVFDGTSFEFFIDGVLDASYTLAGTVTLDSSRELAFSWTSGINPSLKCYDLAWYNKALNTTELGDLVTLFRNY